MTKLNVGAGNQPMAGYVNIDIHPMAPGVVYGNAVDLSFPDDSVEEIYTSHMIEHLTKAELRSFFRECQRVLIAGGKLYIVAPSMEGILDAYKRGLVTIDYAEDFLFARQLHAYDYHKQGIYLVKLEYLCAEYGFKILSCIDDRVGDDFKPGGSRNPEILLEAEKG